jgi:DNA-binding PadR family transcriptional regulator
VVAPAIVRFVLSHGLLTDRKKVQMLTELEGAVLSEIYHRGQKTAFQVRRAFATSFSLEWKGSAGAIYPAVQRLVKRGLIHASAARGGRGTRMLRVTDKGRVEMMAWACDPVRGASIGIDPFRLRSGIWMDLPRKKRQKVFRALIKAIEEAIPPLQGYLKSTDPVERIRVELGLELQRDRLNRLKAWEK